MKQTYLGKTRDEQDEEIRLYFKPYATPTCKICYGTGKASWVMDLAQYRICECVMINIEREKQAQEKLITKVELVN